MTVELNKKDLIHLVKGTQPSYNAMGNPVVAICGIYDDNRGWLWYDNGLADCSEEQLYAMYLLCKNN